MFEKYSDYNIILPGYKMQLLLDSLKYYDEENPSYEIQNLINELQNVNKKEYSEEV